MKSLAEECAWRFYEIHERLIFLRNNFSRTTLQGKLWKDLKDREKLEYVESFRQLLADEEIMRILANRAAGL